MKFEFFSITNPIFKNIFCFTIGITKNKTFEFQVYHYFDFLLTFEIHLSFRGKDHDGPHLEFSLLGFHFCFVIYDNRHWDYERNDWKSTGE